MFRVVSSQLCISDLIYLINCVWKLIGRTVHNKGIKGAIGRFKSKGSKEEAKVNAPRHSRAASRRTKGVENQYEN